MNKLKYCPFCGPEQSVVTCYQDEFGYWTVGCGRCGSHSGKRPPSDKEGRSKVIRLWNGRPYPVIEVAGQVCETSLSDHEQACLVLITEEQAKPNCDNHLIAALCNSVRLALEFSIHMAIDKNRSRRLGLEAR